MSRRIANNRIRGPQSALTDFLASNNISAAQIASDYERRRREAQQQAEQDINTNGETREAEDEPERQETAAAKKKRKRQEEKALAKIKESKDFKRHKKLNEGGPDGDDDEVAWDMYAKKVPLPGQLENCEICEKRFTVTAYSKEGPEGGLLCTKCSKEQEAQRKKDQKPKRQSVSRGKVRQAQSNLLDGFIQNGSKSLQELCIRKVADNIHDVDEFGDLPQSLLKRLSQILSKRRVVTSRTLDLFLRPDLDAVDVYDCGKLEVEDYIKIFSVISNVQTINLRNAGQFKDEVVDYILEREVPLKHVQLEAANLVSNQKWVEFFERGGYRFESLKLEWLDYSLDDDAFTHLIQGCPNIQRLKLKKCFRLGDAALGAMRPLKHLEHLSLRFPSPTSPTALAELIVSVGLNLRTLSLESFNDADDSVLSAIHSNCTHLKKLRFTENDLCTDSDFVSLFTDWSNPPLTFIDLNSNRSIDCSEPDGPEQAIGLASTGFLALMNHSGTCIERLDISSCRHIEYSAFSDVFDGKKRYPNLKDINVSFLTKIDTAIVAGMFRSCPLLVKVTAFGCSHVKDVAVPKGVALIGLPNAQDSIVQEGDVDADMWC